MKSVEELESLVGGLCKRAVESIERVGSDAFAGAVLLIEKGMEPTDLSHSLADNPRVYRPGVFDQGLMLQMSMQMIKGSPGASGFEFVVRALADGNEGRALEFLAASEAGADGALLLLPPDIHGEDFFSHGILEDKYSLDQAGIDFITTTHLVQVTSSWRKIKHKVKFWVGDQKNGDPKQRTGLADLPFVSQVAWYFAHLRLMARSVAGEHSTKDFKLIMPKGTLGGIPNEVREVLIKRSAAHDRDATHGVGISLEEIRGRIR